MANNFGKGIKVTSGFDLSAKGPLDNRTICDTIAQRDAHSAAGRAYEGLTVYVLATKKEYRYDGFGWIETGGLTEEQISQLEVAYAHSKTDHVSVEEVETALNSIESKINNLPTKTMLDGKADSNHIHEDIYYSKTEMDDKLAYISSGGTLDLESYAKKNEVEQALTGKSDVGHIHDISNISNLQNILTSKADASNVYNKIYINEKIEELTVGLTGKSDSGHNHNDTYYNKSEVDRRIANAVTDGQVDLSNYATLQHLDAKADWTHTHTGIYSEINHKHDLDEITDLSENIYTKDQIDSFLSEKSDGAHVHDDRYFTQLQVEDKIVEVLTSGELSLEGYVTKQELTSQMASKSDAGHGHNASEISGLQEMLPDTYTKQEIDNAIDQVAKGKSDLGHGHEMSEITGLIDELNTKANINNVATKAELESGLGGKSDSGHNHDDKYYDKATVESMIETGIQGAELEKYATKDLLSNELNKKADWGHTHILSDMPGLSEELDKKANADSVALKDDLNGYSPAGHNHDDKYYTKEAVDQRIQSGLDGVDLSGLATKAELSGKSDIGHLHDIDQVNNLSEKLTTMEASIETNTTTIETGLKNKSDVGHNHDNEYYTKAVVDQKIQSGIDGVDLTGLATKAELDGKSDIGHGHGISEIANLTDKLNTMETNISSNAANIEAGLQGKSDSGHKHDDDYSKLDHKHLSEDITDLAEKYYTKQQVDASLTGKSDSSHNHDDKYYTKAIVDQKIQSGIDGVDLSGLATKTELAGKSDIGHGHDINQINNLSDKLNTIETNIAKNTTDIETGLQGKSDSSHRHDDDYSPLGHVHDASEITSLANNFYTKTEIDTALNDKSDSGHNHNNEYYTKAIVDQKIQAGIDGVDLSGLATKAELDGKSDIGHGHGINEIANLTDELNTIKTGIQNNKDSIESGLKGKADSEHNHDDIYSKSDHEHDASEILNLNKNYYTKSEIDTALNNKSETSHKHDDVYSKLDHKHGVDELVDISDNFYNKDEIDTALSEKAPSNHLHEDKYAQKTHTHELNEIVNLTTDFYTKEEVDAALTLNETESQAYTTTAIANLVDSAPEAMNTLNELATAIRNNKDVYDAYVDSVSKLLEDKSDVNHHHDDKYSPLKHNHELNELEGLENKYYDKTQIDSLLNDKSETGHGHGISEITNLNSILNSKADANTAATKDELNNALKGKSDSNHNHNDDYSPLGHHHELSDIDKLDDKFQSERESILEEAFDSATILVNNKAAEILGGEGSGIGTIAGLNTALQTHINEFEKYQEDVTAALSGKSDDTHKHDNDYSPLGHKHELDDLLNLIDNYYTESEVNNLLKGKSDTGHKHDDDYAPKDHTHEISEMTDLLDNFYTEFETNELLKGKSDNDHLHENTYSPLGHTHNLEEVLNLTNNFYSKTETDELLKKKSDFPHFHDDRYYLKYQVDAKINDLQIGKYATLENLQAWAELFELKGHKHEDASAFGMITEDDLDNMLINIYGSTYNS